MPDSSTGDEALNNGAVGGENLPSSADQGNGDNTGVSTEASPTTETQDDNKPKDIADAVRAALSGGKEQSSSSGEDEGKTEESDTAGSEDKPKTGEEDDLGELRDDELKECKPKTRRRFEKFIRENKALAAQVADFEPKVRNFEAIQNFAQKANLGRDDINTGFEIMRLLRNDPVKGYEALTPIYEQLRALVGDVLPRDLQTQVDSGQITLPAAKELSRLRAVQGVTTNIQREQQERESAQRQQEVVEHTQQLQTSVASAITKWESDWKASDPDYSLKQGRVSEAIELELQRALNLAKEGKPNRLPRTVEQAVALANEVKKRVEKELRQFTPKRNTPITPVTGHGVTNGSKPVASSVHDAVRMAIGQK